MKLFTYLKGDRVIWAVVFLLSLLSILVVYSSVVTLAHKYKQGNTESYLIKHAITIIGGLFMMYVVHKMRYTFFSRVAQIGVFFFSAFIIIYFTKRRECGRSQQMG